MITHISFCVTTYNSESIISSLLDKLSETAEHAGINYEIIVIDNNSADLTVDLVNNCSNASLIQNQDIGNVSRSRNLAMKEARYRYCWFFDDDSLVDKNLVVKAMPMLEKTNADVIMPLVINSNGVPLNCKKKHNNKIDYSLDADEIILDFSSCFIINAETIREKNLYFDEDIKFMWEDVEYFYRLKRNGVRFVYTHSLPIQHRVKEINNRMGKRFYLQTKNAIILFRYLSKDEKRDFRNYCPGGNFYLFMILSFFTALLNYNFWADFYNPKVETQFDRIKNLFNPERIKLDRSNITSMYYFFNGILNGLSYIKKV